MFDHDLKQLTLDELSGLLATAQRNLELSSQRKEGAVVIEQNKSQLAKVMKAIVDKREDPLPQK